MKKNNNNKEEEGRRRIIIKKKEEEEEEKEEEEEEEEDGHGRDPTSHKVVISRDVVFNEEPMLKPDWLKEEKVQEQDDGRTILQAEHGDMVISSKNPIEVEHVGPSHDEVISSDNQSEHVDQSLDTYILARDRERRVIKAPVRLGFEDAIAYALMIGGGDPTSYKEAMNSKEASKWMIAMQGELESLYKNETWVWWSYRKGKRLLDASGFFGVKKLYPKKMGKGLRPG